MSLIDEKALKAEQLRRTFDPKTLDLKSAESCSQLEGIIGQSRAVSALSFGLGMERTGFNIFVAGPPGIGKMTAVQRFLEKHAGDKETPADWCYVNNFEDSYQPQVCHLPAGKGRRLQQDMEDLIQHFRDEIPKAFEGDDYDSKRERIIKDFDDQRTAIQEEVSKKAKESSFNLEVTPQGIALIPLLGGRPLKEAEISELPEEAREDIKKRREAIEQELKQGLKQIRALQRETQERVRQLDKQVALFVVGDQIEDLIEKYDEFADVVEFLRAVKQDIQENIDTFRKQGQSDGGNASTAPPWQQELPFRKYQVNVLVDHANQQGAPVVIELNPNYTNLFGRIEKEVQFGALHTDFLMTKAGSLHRANGGYLVLPIEGVLQHQLSWYGLKRAIQSGEIKIEEPADLVGAQVVKSLRPQPIPFDVKVVLVGSPMFYFLLHNNDEEFAELFKVKADFDVSMKCEDDRIVDFLSFLCTLREKDNLLEIDNTGAAAMLEQALRLSGDQEKISIRFGSLADLAREANYWARQAEAKQISSEHVQQALEQKVYRSNLIQVRINEMIERGTLYIDTEAETVGQVNGLSVITVGDYPFGRPSRITASVGPGRGGILDIEREIKLGGPIHSKGVLIISGYLTRTFASDYPLTLSSRLVFEQSYEGIDGDSASSTELYTLLSALSEVPIRQGIAVTGSVNQNGEVQPIGGANEKIEGYFEVCRLKGLTGKQGVMIPAANVRNLMLKQDVVDAVREGEFHIWAVSTIDEGIEILTGKQAGARNDSGEYPEDSINYLVDRRLREYAKIVRTFGRNDRVQ